MFQWLKYWEGWRTVIGVVLLPVALISMVFLLPFMDRGLERRPWRRPIPVGGVFVVLFGLLWLGMTSHLADSRDPPWLPKLRNRPSRKMRIFMRRFSPMRQRHLRGRVRPLHSMQPPRWGSLSSTRRAAASVTARADKARGGLR